MATCRMAAFRPAALPCERGMRCEKRGHSQVPHRRLAMVLAARGNGRTHGRIREENGKPTSRPYFSIDGHTEIMAEQWDSLRAVWNHVNGLTNVWSRPPLHDRERLKGTLQRSAPRVYKPSKQSAAHLNQKPLDFMDRQIHAASNEGDVVWEPFGGLASASVAAVLTGRIAYTAEIDEEFQNLALGRLAEAEEEYDTKNANDTMTLERRQA